MARIVALGLLAGAMTAAGLWMTGAMVAHAVELEGAAGTALAALAAFVLCGLLPLYAASRVLTLLGERVQRRALVTLVVITAWQVAVLVLALGAVPSSTRAAVVANADWFVPAALDPVWSARARALAHRLAPTADAVTEAEDDGAGSASIPGGQAADPAPPEPQPEGRSWTARDIHRHRVGSVAVIRTQASIDALGDMQRRLMEEMGRRYVEGMGSGFFVAPDLLVTNHHVIDGAAHIRVDVSDGRRATAVSTLAVAPEHDLALLKLDLPGAPVRPAPLAEGGTFEIGAPVFALGSPLGLEYTLTEGIVSAEREIQGASYIQMQTAIAPGSSGGPLFDERGQVVGVNTAAAGTGLYLAVQVRHVHELLRLPREARPLLPLVPGWIVTSIEIDGDADTPTERERLQGALSMAAQGLQGCVEDGPVLDAPLNVRVRFPPRGTAAARRQITSDGTPEHQACLAAKLDGPMRMLGLLAQITAGEHPPSLRATFGDGDAAEPRVLASMQLTWGD